MKQQGRLTEWNDDRGFGFITPLGNGRRVFVHISDFPRDTRRPIVNDLVTYTLGQDGQGRPRATGVRHLIPTRPVVPASPGRPIVFLVYGVVLALAVIGALYVGWSQNNGPHAVVESFSPSRDEAVTRAFQEHSSGIQVEGEGVVTRVLEDDNDGSRHQRFIVRLASGQTLLVAHNIDIAPRLSSLRAGDSVAFNGVYEWNPKGGVIHWTHHDPSGQHKPGWLKHNGSTFQ